MTTIEQHIEGFEKLGQYLREIDINVKEYSSLFDCLRKAQQNNGWFTEENCLKALHAWGEVLQAEALQAWAKLYSFGATAPKNIGLILAGNIPLVGFHDVLCVLLCGHNATVKLSSTDPLLIPFIYEQLQGFSPAFKDRLHFTEDRLENFDAVIATGSNNAARYFEHYFAQVPILFAKTAMELRY